VFKYYSREAFTTYLKYLQTFNGQGKADITDEVKAVARKIIAQAIQIPSVFNFSDLLSFEAIRSLDGEPAFSLLKVYIDGDLSDLRKLLSTNASLPDQIGLCGHFP